MSICVYLWADFLLAKARGRIRQEVTECAEGLDKSALFAPFSPVCSILLAANKGLDAAGRRDLKRSL